MIVSIFLAKALGLYLFVAGVGLVVKRRDIKSLLNNFLDNGAASYLSGLIAINC